MPRTRRWAIFTLAALTAIGLSACTKNPTSAPSTAALPDGSQLLLASAAAMREVKTAHVTIDVQGTVGSIGLHHADGTLTRSGDAKGTATVEQLGATVEVEFVIVGGKVYLKGPTGGFQQVPAALASQVYDPSAILDADRGVAKLLTAVKSAKTEAKESVGGQDAYRVAVTPAPGSLDALIPGVGDQATGKLWIAADSKRLLKGVFTVPPSGSDKGGTITITFTDYDAPVTISAP
jgi:lipoprotein LprG